MGFGSFLSNAGYGFEGADDAATKLTALRSQQMANTNAAIATRANQDQEAQGQDAFKKMQQAQANLSTAVAPVVPGANTSNTWSYNPPAVNPAPAPAQPTGPTNTSLGLASNESFVAPSPTDNSGAISALQARINAGTAKLKQLNSATATQATNDHNALATGGNVISRAVNAGIPGMRAITGALPLAANTINSARNLAGRMGNAINGTPIYKTDFETNNGTPANIAPHFAQAPINPDIATTQTQLQADQAALAKLKAASAAAKAVKNATPTTVASAQADPNNRDSTVPVDVTDPAVQSQFLKSIMPIESGGNPAAGKSTNYIGISQMGPGLRKDASALLGKPLDMSSYPGQVEATNAGLQVVAKQLAARNIPVTMDALRSAWLQGAGGVAANGIYATNVHDKNGTTPAAYVAKAGGGSPITKTLGLVSPISTADAADGVVDPSALTPIPAGTQFSLGADSGIRDPHSDLFDQQVRIAQTNLSTARNWNQYQAATQQLQDAKDHQYESQIATLAHAGATGTMTAIGHLASLMSSQTGAQIGIAKLKNGEVVLASPDGTIINRGTPAQVSSYLLNNTSPALQARAAGTAGIYNDSFAKTSAEENAKLPGARQLEADKAANSNATEHAKAQNEYNIHVMDNIAGIIKTKLQAGGKEDDLKGIIQSQMGDGGVYSWTSKGAVYKGPPVMVGGKLVEAQPIVVANADRMKALIAAVNK